jgi:hypothetical protein
MLCQTCGDGLRCQQCEGLFCAECDQVETYVLRPRCRIRCCDECAASLNLRKRKRE